MSTAALLSEHQGVDKLTRRSADGAALHQMGAFRLDNVLKQNSLDKEGRIPRSHAADGAG
jgi:hypothetical protein